MIATEVLRRMLDERGVEWKAWDGTHPITVWHGETYLYEFIEYRLINGAKQVSNCPSDDDGHCELTIKVFNCTPEQAIAATLGSCNCPNNCTNGERTETCHDEGDPSDFCCSECGVRMFTNTSDTYTMIASDGRTIIKHPNYCPNCGRRIEQ